MGFVLRKLGRKSYEQVFHAMRDFTEERDADTADEVWLVEHEPVYTLGLNGDPSHIIGPLEAPLVQTDRGGQVTYHGPGQLLLYVLLDLQRRDLGVRTLVSLLEDAVIRVLAQYGISAEARRDAPGVYVEGRKIAFLGLRIRRGCCYHGIALNVNLNLEPFHRIHPCGHPGLQVTRLVDWGVDASVWDPAAPLVRELMIELGDEEILP